MRLDKFLVEMGLGSQQVKSSFKEETEVLVNRRAVTSAKVQVDEYQE